MAEKEVDFDEVARAYMELKGRKNPVNIDSDEFNSFITGVPVKTELKNELDNSKFNIFFNVS